MVQSTFKIYLKVCSVNIKLDIDSTVSEQSCKDLIKFIDSKFEHTNYHLMSITRPNFPTYRHLIFEAIKASDFQPIVEDSHNQYGHRYDQKEVPVTLKDIEAEIDKIYTEYSNIFLLKAERVYDHFSECHYVFLTYHNGRFSFLSDFKTLPVETERRLFTKQQVQFIPESFVSANYVYERFSDTDYFYGLNVFKFAADPKTALIDFDEYRNARGQLQSAKKLVVVLKQGHVHMNFSTPDMDKKVADFLEKRDKRFDVDDTIFAQMIYDNIVIHESFHQIPDLSEIMKTILKPFLSHSPDILKELGIKPAFTHEFIKAYEEGVGVLSEMYEIG